MEHLSFQNPLSTKGCFFGGLNPEVCLVTIMNI